MNRFHKHTEQVQAALAMLLLLVVFPTTSLGKDTKNIEQSQAYEMAQEIIKKAKKEGDVEICTQSEPYTFDGGDYTAVVSKNRVVDNCYYAFALYKVDSKFCFRINDLAKKFECLQYLHHNPENKSICHDIPKQDDYTTMRVYSECIARYFKKAIDLEDCNRFTKKQPLLSKLRHRKHVHYRKEFGKSCLRWFFESRPVSMRACEQYKKPLFSRYHPDAVYSLCINASQTSDASSVQECHTQYALQNKNHYFEKCINSRLRHSQKITLEECDFLHEKKEIALSNECVNRIFHMYLGIEDPCMKKVTQRTRAYEGSCNVHFYKNVDGSRAAKICSDILPESRRFSMQISHIFEKICSDLLQ